MHDWKAVSDCWRIAYFQTPARGTAVAVAEAAAEEVQAVQQPGHHVEDIEPSQEKLQARQYKIKNCNNLIKYRNKAYTK